MVWLGDSGRLWSWYLDGQEMLAMWISGGGDSRWFPGRVDLERGAEWEHWAGRKAAEGKGKAGPSLVRGVRFVPGCCGLSSRKKGKQLR